MKIRASLADRIPPDFMPGIGDAEAFSDDVEECRFTSPRRGEVGMGALGAHIPGEGAAVPINRLFPPHLPPTLSSPASGGG